MPQLMQCEEISIIAVTRGGGVVKFEKEEAEACDDGQAYPLNYS